MLDSKSIYIILVLFLGIIYCYASNFYIKSFDSDYWKNSWSQHLASTEDGIDKFSPMSLRVPMARYVVYFDKLNGLSKNQVVELLGMDHNEYASNDWQYWLKFTASDNLWLKIEFKDNLVYKYYLYED